MKFDITGWKTVLEVAKLDEFIFEREQCNPKSTEVWKEKSHQQIYASQWFGPATKATCSKVLIREADNSKSNALFASVLSCSV